MSGISRVAAVGLLFAALAGSVSWAQTAQDDKATKERAARELAEAVAACDKGASAPLDFTANPRRCNIRSSCPTIST